MTEAEAQELAVRKRRAEGTPCTLENFEAWKAKFEAEMAEKENQSEADVTDKKKKVEDKSGRQTGKEQFLSKATNLEALEAAAAQAEEEDDDNEIDEDLFEDDVDVDDLDFDSDEEDEDDEVDI